MLWLSIALVVLGTLAVSAGVLLGQTVAGGGELPGAPGWLSFAGLAALLGLAVQWGEHRRQVKQQGVETGEVKKLAQAAVPREEFTDRMDRLEDKIDRRFDSLAAAIERRRGGA